MAGCEMNLESGGDRVGSGSKRGDVASAIRRESTVKTTTQELRTADSTRLEHALGAHGRAPRKGA